MAIKYLELQETTD